MMILGNYPRGAGKWTVLLRSLRACWRRGECTEMRAGAFIPLSARQHFLNVG
jgi:hypothetical protein